MKIELPKGPNKPVAKSSDAKPEAETIADLQKKGSDAVIAALLREHAPPPQLVAASTTKQAKVIELPVKPRNFTPLMRTVGYPKTCLAHQFEFDLKTRTVECSGCKHPFAAFDALVYITQKWTRYAMELRHYQDEIARLREERDELDRIVKNLKAQKKRAHETLTKEGQR